MSRDVVRYVIIWFAIYNFLWVLYRIGTNTICNRFEDIKAQKYQSHELYLHGM